MKVELKIEGIKCEGCINRIENTLSGMKEIMNSEFDSVTNILQIKVKKEIIIEKVMKKINDLGFKAIKVNMKK